MTGSPSALPTGTLPEAIAPTTVPMKNGVRSDESPNRRAARCLPFSVLAVLWNANPEPRSTMPSAARLSGMNRVEKMEPNASENPVHSTTSTKMSHTWLASQTGPIAQSASSRARRPRSPSSGHEAPEPRPEVGAAEHGVEGHADPQDAGDCVGRAQVAPSGSVGGGSPAGP